MQGTQAAAAGSLAAEGGDRHAAERMQLALSPYASVPPHITGMVHTLLRLATTAPARPSSFARLGGSEGARAQGGGGGTPFQHRLQG